MYTPRVRGLREMLLLSDAKRVVSSRTPERHAEIRRWWAAARARLRVAERLDPMREQLAAVPLYREGLRALAGAAIAAAEGAPKAEDVADLDAAWSALERVWSKLHIPTPLSDFVPARDALREQVALDAPPRRIGDALATIDRLARLLERAIEPRSMRFLTWRPRAVVTTLALAMVALLAWTVPPLLGPKDVALGKPVKISSSHPESTGPADGTWLVNGRVERVYAAQTKSEDNPWMQIDLQQETPIKRVVVYNRGDGWFSDSLPLDLLLGDEESKLRSVAHREVLFTQFHPWVIDTNETARYVRVVKRGHGGLALSEIEVYSR